jgi:glycogen operon protein
VFRRRHFFQGRKIRGSELEDIRWLRPDGQEMSDEEWNSDVRAFGILLGGDAMMEWDESGERVEDDTFLLLFNGAPEAQPFTLPATPTPAYWEIVLDTSRSTAEQEALRMDPETSLETQGRSMTVLRRLEAGRGD